MSLAAAYRSPKRFYGRGFLAKVRSLTWGGGPRGDRNSKELDDRWLAFGCSVVKLDKIGDGVPDRLIGMPIGNGTREDFFCEYKNPNGDNNHKHLRESQKVFFEKWLGKTPEIAWTVADIDAIVLRKRKIG